ncbi:MAG: FtsX-like permease family protein [Anaerolineaceae bacterium]|nr:FtsX-like permease family protein [Anaerolineaceae bacterium]
MRPRWRKVLADLWGNFARFILVVLSLTIGLFSVGMIASGYFAILDDMESGYQAIHPADLRMITTDFDEALIERVRRVDGVIEADGEKLVKVRTLTGDDEWTNLIIRVIPEQGQKIDQVTLIDGAFPEDDQIMLDIHKDTGWTIGDTLQVQLSSGKVRDLAITGTVQDQTIGEMGTSYFVAPTYGYITFETLPFLEETQAYNTLLVELDPALTEVEIAAVTAEVTGLMEQSGHFVTSTMDMSANDHPNIGYIQAVSGLLALLGFLVVFLSGFLVFNAMSALFAQQTQYIGIMKAIGGRRKIIIRMYVVFIVVFSLIAMAIAIPTAPWAWTKLSDFFSLRLNYQSAGFRYVPIAVVLQVVVGLILPQVAGIIPILHASKVSVQQAITQTGIESDEFSKAQEDRQTRRKKGLSRPMLISLRNTFRRKSRLALTLITLSLGGAVFISSFNVRGSLENYIDQVSNYLLADVNLDFARNYRINEIEKLTMNIYGVQSVEPRGNAYCQLVTASGEAGESVDLLGAPPESNLVQPILLEGRWLIPGDQNAIALNEAFLKRYPDLKVGDEITLFINRREVDWTIVGFFQFIGSDSFIVYVPLDYLNEVTGSTNQASNYQIVATPEIVQQGLEADLAARIDAYFRDNGFDVASASDSGSIIGNATLGLDTLTFFLLIMSGLTAAVGSIGLMGTMSMNVMERTREIGVMRAIGATDRQVMNQVLVEGLLIGLISWVLAFALAFPISYLMSYTVNTSIFGIAGKFTFDVSGVFIWLAIVVVLSLVASFLPARNAARLTIREVLAYE